MSNTLANGGNARRRRALDYYPTPPDVTTALMKWLRHRLPPPAVVWEPACGDGAMVRVLQDAGYDVIATDLQEQGGCVDFLQARRTCDMVITNPPFTPSEEFIRHALTITPNVAMLLKSQYWHAARRRHLFQQTKPAFVLPLTWRPDFRNSELGGSPTMEVLWTVWMANRPVDGTLYEQLSRP